MKEHAKRYFLGKGEKQAFETTRFYEDLSLLAILSVVLSPLWGACVYLLLFGR